MTTMTEVTKVFRVFIRTTPEELWKAITDPEFTEKYYYGTRVDSTMAPGDAFVYRTTEGGAVSSMARWSSRPAAPPGADVPGTVERRDGGRAAEPGHLGDRGRRAGSHPAHHHARPARRVAAHRRGDQRLVLHPQRAQDPAGDRKADGVDGFDGTSVRAAHAAVLGSRARTGPSDRRSRRRTAHPHAGFRVRTISPRTTMAP